MKSMMKNLALMSMGLMIYSCNEKISPELQNGNSTTVPTVIVPTDYYFQVTNNSPVVLNYLLHRTGPGKATTECKINSTGIPLSSTLYVGDAATAFDSKAYDIACYLEAEELSMFFNGLSFKVEASKNTCEYVGYAPYSYFDAIPGVTTANWRGVKCEQDVGTVDAQATVALPSGVDVLGGATRQIGCEEMVDTSIPLDSDRLIIPIPDNYQPLCAFDYSTNGGGNSQNCDSGRMKIDITSVSKVTPPDPAPAYFTSAPISTPDHICGGSTTACVEGAIKSVSSLNGTRGTEIVNSTMNEDFSKEYSLPALMGVRSSNVDIVNYRRGLASKHLNFKDYTSTNEPLWSDTNYNKAFDPSLMEAYAANKTPDGNPIIDVAGGAASPHVSNASFLLKQKELGYMATPLAADPYLGTVSRVNPFYTFYCLDRAFEIKARIRMVVRDWDRVFPSTTSDLELISDVYKNINARSQDLPTDEEEIPGDFGNANYYNDIYDWDTWVHLDRSDPNSIGVYDPGFTFWSPTLGWWNPIIFPNQGPTN